jgi:hemoglobin
VASLYETVGGQPFFDELARRFYEEVRSDEVLLALYPDPEDLGPAAERLALFLAQYWGGPTTYSDRRGHPRLRMRHAPYRIGGDERDRWLRAVTTALAATVDPTAGHLGELDAAERSQVERQLLDYLTMAADHLVNDPS